MENKKKRKRKGFRLKHLIILFLALMIGKTFISQSIMFRDLIEKKEKEEAEVAQLEREIQQLNQEIQDKDSLEFVERVAREDLRMVKPREIIYIDRNKDKKGFMNSRTK